MFTYIKLKNFLSLGDVYFDFRKTKTDIKHLAIIYGENGSGKTNFIHAFSFLFNSIYSFAYQQNYEKLISAFRETDERVNDILRTLSLFSNFSEYMSELRMIDSDEPTEVEYGFMMNEREAIYRLAFTDHIIEESLYCFTGKQRGFLFQFSSDPNGETKTKMQAELIKQTAYKKEIMEKIDQYWGKHSFLSIITNQRNDKNSKFVKENISPFFLDALKQLKNLFITSKLSQGNERHVRFNETDIILQNLDSGTVSSSEIPIIRRTEEVLRDFFTQAYADIKDVKYELTNLEDNKCRYQLYVDKMICGKTRRISFTKESAGTQQVLRIIRSLIGLFFGVTVVYDEIDNGVHDILLTQIIKSLQNEITGQLIITTHNTMLLEEMDPHSVYIISTDYLGNKKIHCADEYAVQTNHNLRTRYLKGLFGGIPYVDGIDFDAIEHFLAEGGNASWQEKRE